MTAVFDARKQKEGDAENELNQYKTPLDDQIALTATEKGTWESLKVTLAEKQTAWDNRDQTAGVDNS